MYVCMYVQVSMMSREQMSVSELLLSLDSSELQEAEQVRAAVNQQLSTGESTCLSVGASQVTYLSFPRSSHLT